MSAILFLKAVLQGTYFFSLPRALWRAALRAPKTTSEIEVTDDGLTIRSGKSTNHLPWKVFSFIWIYEDFILLPFGKIVLNRFVWVPTSGMTAEVLTAFQTARHRPAI
jgi:YcxB-like protein